MTGAAYAELSNIAQALKAAHQDVGKESERLLDETADNIKELMIALAPKRTGRLAQSIAVIAAKGQRIIGPQGVPYAVYQEFGTASRGEFGGPTYIIKPVRAENLVFQVNGKWVTTKEVRHPGIPPHPFARPAAKAAIEGLSSQYLELGVNLILEGKQ